MSIRKFSINRSVSTHARSTKTQQSDCTSTSKLSRFSQAHSQSLQSSSMKLHKIKRSISENQTSDKHLPSRKLITKTNLQRMKRIKERVMEILKQKMEEGVLQKIFQMEVNRLCEKYFIEKGVGYIFYDRLIKEYEQTMINHNKKLIMQGTISASPTYPTDLVAEASAKVVPLNTRSQYDRDNDSINAFYNSPSHLRYVYQAQYRPDEYHKITNTLLLPSIQDYYSKFVNLTKKKDKKLRL